MKQSNRHEAAASKSCSLMPSTTLIGLQSQCAHEHMYIHNPRSQALQVAQTTEPQMNSRTAAQAYEPVAMLCQEPMWNQVLPASELSSCHDDYADHADMQHAATEAHTHG